MSNWPFRFVHAADFHLETPPFGVTEIPAHLRELFLESPYWAAERVFETVLAEEAEFLVLSGDILHAQKTGPRGPLFLVDQFERLAERQIPVYWACGRVDPPESWPSSILIPDNVHIFGRGITDEYVLQHEGSPLVRLIGAGRGRSSQIRAADFTPDRAGLFSIAITHGKADRNAFEQRGLNYWALGGRHNRNTLSTSPCVIHYPGSPQGRHSDEPGPHGCTLVQVDSHGQSRTTLVPTDVLRWHNERIVVDEATDNEQLQTLLRERIHTLTESASGIDLLVSWTVAGSGPVMDTLRYGPLAMELLDMLRSEYGFGPPAAWTASFSAEPTAVLPPQWYEQQTIRGDFLRTIHQYQTNADDPLGLEEYLSEEQLAGTLNATVAISNEVTRQQVLREAALLGVDLLSGEEP